MRSALTEPRSRNRFACAIACTIAIGCGLASRRYPNAATDLFGKYPGDALWAVMMFFAWGAFRPRSSALGVASLALATCFVVEFMKLDQASWIVGIRHTPFGHLVFGHVFSWQNLVAYVVGVVVAVVGELVFFSLRSARS